ncbi:DNA-3-methyladenine glycosylase I [Haliea sp. E1-2-M8]|uniref:DNA-3-methyladenine glycosylase I n=1 Tax=Haliea sp. E1-2-M8 TaxID=3064706 RepID=UPI0027286838|nr:DNA-3-methyladenine glycosylase I [Haliea sp. E1-2-M8]MDO8862577.1 DNA-3-methyladenine glycosylase I [Haliea sp. E1-2-M8]
MPERCGWCGSDPLYVAYHDSEWGVPVHDDSTLFEFLILEGAQAGLAWITVLRKREGYRKLFAGFDAQRIARFSDRKLDSLLGDPSIIRNRLKVYGARQNARAFLAVQEKFGSFANYMWRFVDGEPIRNRWANMGEVPASTPLSDAISKDMKQRGFTFVGTTILYAHMQATGMVNDHILSCFRHSECSELAGLYQGI